MNLFTLAIMSLFFNYCLAQISGASFCSGGVFYRWDTKGYRCHCGDHRIPASCVPEGNQKLVLSAQKALEAGEKCYRQFNSNEVCRKKCIETFTDDCSKRDRKLYKETTGGNSDFCKRNFRNDPDCL